MVQLTILDTGPLYSALDQNDKYHAASSLLLRDRRYAFVVPALALAEVAYWAEKKLGSAIEAAFAESMASWRIEAPLAHEWPRIAELVRTYADWPLGIVDASVVVLAERLGTDVVATLDRRHFGAISPAHCAAFRLVP